MTSYLQGTFEAIKYGAYVFATGFIAVIAMAELISRRLRHPDMNLREYREIRRLVFGGMLAAWCITCFLLLK